MKTLLYYSFLVILAFNCTNKPGNSDPIPKHDNFTINSQFVDEERVINVWIPENYNAITDSLPVLYMPDGGIKEDFPHIANTISKLIASKSIPPTILVGIENTERGRDLTGFSEIKDDEQYCPLTDGAKNFRAFITQELMLKIDSEYRTNTKKGLIGESLAGLFVIETLFLQPEAFDYYIAMDPSLWWNNHYLERKASDYLKQFPDKDITLWFAGSAVEDISIHTNNLAKTLENDHPNNLIWNYSNEPNEEHSTIFRATKEKAMIWAMNKNE